MIIKVASADADAAALTPDVRDGASTVARFTMVATFGAMTALAGTVPRYLAVIVVIFAGKVSPLIRSTLPERVPGQVVGNPAGVLGA